MKKGHHIITGDIDSGKSSRLRKLYLKLRKTNNVSGWISPPFFRAGKKRGYDIIFIRNSRELKPRRFIREKRFEGAFRWRRFWFDKKVFMSAARLARSARGGAFFIDEVGPLELVDRRGFWNVLRIIYKNFETTVTVVRKDCLKILTRTRLHIMQPKLHKYALQPQVRKIVNS